MGDAWNCTDGQKGFILRIVNENPSITKQVAEDLSQQLFGIGVKQLNKMQASQLIEDLLVKVGKPAPRQTRWRQQQPTIHGDLEEVFEKPRILVVGGVFEPSLMLSEPFVQLMSGDAAGSDSFAVPPCFPKLFQDGHACLPCLDLFASEILLVILQQVPNRLSGLAGLDFGEVLQPCLEVSLCEFAVGGTKAVLFSIAQHLGDAIIDFVYIMAIQTRKSGNLLQELSSALALHALIIGGDKRGCQANLTTRQITCNALIHNTLGL